MRATVGGLALVVAVCSSVQADPDPKWIGSAIGVKEAAIKYLAEKMRDVRCPVQDTAAKREACVAGYNMQIARRTAEKAHLEFMLKSLALESRDRLVVFGTMQADERFGRMDADTTAMGGPLDILFPASVAKPQRK